MEALCICGHTEDMHFITRMADGKVQVMATPCQSLEYSCPCFKFRAVDLSIEDQFDHDVKSIMALYRLTPLTYSIQ